MPKQECRWGILGTAGIARKNWKAIKLSGNACVTAVASRSVESAQRFIDECSSQVPPTTTPEALGSYEDLLSRDDVDAVYIPLPTALRFEWVLKAAEAGKHVMGEKPAATNATQVAEMLEVCKQNNVQYMDGVMFMHSARLPMIRSVLDDPNQLGKVRRLTSQFSFAGDEEFCRSNIRTHSELEPHGCLGDLGWYCSRMFMWILRGEMPSEVRARVLTPLQGQGSPDSVPGEFTAELTFADGVTACFYNSFITENQQYVCASGDKGWMRLDDFVLPYHGAELAINVAQDRFEVDNCEFHMEQHHRRLAVREYDSNQPGSQEVRLFQKFSDLVNKGELDPTWPEWTLKTQKVLDACFESSKQDGAVVQIT